MKTYIITGGNRGLGLAIAKALAAVPESEIVLAVRDLAAGKEVAAGLGSNVSAREIDMSSAASIDRFVAEWDQPIAGLVNNAGVQITDASRFTEEGFEQTFAVNHLFALKLTVNLLPHLEGGRVLFIGSGTHNPKNRTATMFGFRGARFESIRKCAEGLDDPGNINQWGMDRYATSKFLNMVSTVELSRRLSPEQAAFFCLDPGLMAGTGLARTAPAIQQFAWKHVLPILARLLPDTSTTRRSGQAGAWLLGAERDQIMAGEIYSYDKAPSSRIWENVKHPEVGKYVINDSLALLGLEQKLPSFTTMQPGSWI